MGVNFRKLGCPKVVGVMKTSVKTDIDSVDGRRPRSTIDQYKTSVVDVSGLTFSSCPKWFGIGKINVYLHF